MTLNIYTFTQRVWARVSRVTSMGGAGSVVQEGGGQGRPESLSSEGTAGAGTFVSPGTWSHSWLRDAGCGQGSLLHCTECLRALQGPQDTTAGFTHVGSPTGAQRQKLQPFHRKNLKSTKWESKQFTPKQICIFPKR